MKPLVDVLLRPEGLRDWLSSFPPNEVVGEPRVEGCCPLERYVSGLYGAVVFMEARTYHLRGFVTAMPLTQWQRRFRDGVDSVPEDAITALVALRILDDAEMLQDGTS